MPSPAPRLTLRRFGWLSVLLSGATLFASGLFGMSSVEGTLQAASAEQRQAIHVTDGPRDHGCPRPDGHVRSDAREV